MSVYVVEFVGGGTSEIEVPPTEDLHIALSEQYTAYGDCEIDMVWNRDDPEAEVPL